MSPKKSSSPGNSNAVDKVKEAKNSNEWQGEKLEVVRKLIFRADPEMVEEIKWRKPTNPEGIPVWSHSGQICTGEMYKSHVRLTFAKGAYIDDPSLLFNDGFNGRLWRAITLHESDSVDESAFMELIKRAVALNMKEKQ